MFQPCHGTAPDIAGQGLANPIAIVLSAAMMLEWLAHEKGDSQLAKDAIDLQAAVGSVVLGGKHLTRDLGGSATTNEVAKAIEAHL